MLEDKSLLYAYRNNISNRPDDYKISYDALIIGAFDWFTSPEGFKFWAKVNVDWEVMCMSNSRISFKELKQILDEQESLWTD